MIRHWITKQIRVSKIRKAMWDTIQKTGYTWATFNDKDDTIKFYRLVKEKVPFMQPGEFSEQMDYQFPEMTGEVRYNMFCYIRDYVNGNLFRTDFWKANITPDEARNMTGLKDDKDWKDF